MLYFFYLFIFIQIINGRINNKHLTLTVFLALNNLKDKKNGFDVTKVIEANVQVLGQRLDRNKFLV